MHGYSIEAAQEGGVTIQPGIPSLGYRYLHVGAEVRMQLGDLSLGFGGALLPLLGTGDLEDWFPQASGIGTEGSLELGYALGSDFDVFGMLTARRYAVSFEPDVRDVQRGLPLVGGMVDRYLHLELGLRFAPGARP